MTFIDLLFFFDFLFYQNGASRPRKVFNVSGAFCIYGHKTLFTCMVFEPLFTCYLNPFVHGI